MGLLADLGGEAVHIGRTLLAEDLAVGDLSAFVGMEVALGNESTLDELVEAIADDLAGGDRRANEHVELVADEGGARVYPVGVEGTELLGAGGLVVLAPVGDLDLFAFLDIWANAAETSLTVFPCELISAMCCFIFSVSSLVF